MRAVPGKFARAMQFASNRVETVVPMMTTYFTLGMFPKRNVARLESPPVVPLTGEAPVSCRSAAERLFFGHGRSFLPPA